ncbi:MAG: YbjN domain-containing protein [Bacteroides sp.]|nr:YbjN domain-containing protein [Bacillota bacterium]MCM1394494.1 YbjN domain-containing protein [[Eubacterium] siraeum]MCM1456062.1 YbjN domain-containing protein [Bacteroides sp.]
MSQETDLKQAQNVYKALCEMLDEREWHYEKFDEDLTVKCGVQGDDLPMEMLIEVDKTRQLVTLLSFMPFAIPENRRTALAVAVAQANNGMVDGSFDFDYARGKIIFRMTTSYRASLIGKELFAYMLACAGYTIDEYNDKFLTVAKNEMSIDEILEYIK